MKIDYTDEELKKLLEKIHNGEIDEYDLPEGLYYKIADYLKKGLYEGFGGDLEAFEGKDLELLAELRENIYMFSAAKTFQQVRDMTDLLVDDSGHVRSFSDFEDLASQIFTQYNENWLSAEYDTAISSGRSGVRWNRIENEKATLPFLRMSVVEDDNTSDICEPLDGITLPVDDPFWDEYYPPNHFRCRTTVEQLEEDAQQSSKAEVGEAVEHADQDMDDMFKMNVGKDKVVFNEDHPYFDVASKDKGFAADNFGLPIPEEDE